MNIAIIHDFLDRSGGAEYVLHTMLELYPTADVYTLFAHPDWHQSCTKDYTVITHPTAQFWYTILGACVPKKYVTKLLLPHFAKWIDDIDLNAYDLVMSNSGAWCSNIVLNSDVCHVVYMHSPMRFAWDWTHTYQSQFPWLRIPNALMMHDIRQWDQLGAKREKYLLCNAKTIQKRISKYYHAHAQVIYPPVDVSSIPLNEHKREDYFVSIGSLTSYKGFDLIIQAVESIGKKLIVLGSGPEEKHLRSISNGSTVFLGRVSDEVRNATIAKAQALIQMSEEDFGIVPVEAMAAGTPAICLGKGGAREVVIDGLNGVLFPEQSVPSLITALEHFNTASTWDHHAITESVRHFSKERFLKEFSTAVTTSYDTHQKLTSSSYERSDKRNISPTTQA